MKNRYYVCAVAEVSPLCRNCLVSMTLAGGRAASFMLWVTVVGALSLVPESPQPVSFTSSSDFLHYLFLSIHDLFFFPEAISLHGA